MEIPLGLIGLVGILVIGLAVFALMAVYAERKVSAFIQDRLGPMEVGPYGLFQTFADILKLLTKENIIPLAADKPLFVLAPLLVFVSVFAGFAVLPFAPDAVGASLNIGVLYALAVVSIEVIGLLMAGWASNNKYALIGSVRSVSQIVSYEIPAGLAILSAIMMYGTLHLGEISNQQYIFGPGGQYFFGLWDVSAIGGFVSWGIFRYPHLIAVFIIYFIAVLAECNRAPFDIPEAESELVSGFHLEYGGFRWAVFFLAEYANMLLVCLIAVILFFGGWSSPLPNLIAMDGAERVAAWSNWELVQHFQFSYLTSGTPGTWTATAWGLFWLLTKGLLLITLMMWIRWTFPRVRADQLMRICWKYLTPLALVCFLISGILKLAEAYSH
jgi:NADH-quinone oxidoreductase subunit H